MRCILIERARAKGRGNRSGDLEALNAWTRTVLRDWAFARAWLYGELARG